MIVSILGAMNRRGTNARPLMLACLVVAAAVPSGVFAFQQSGGNGPAPKLGDSKTNSRDGLRYLWIPPGSVVSGCSAGDKECYEDESPSRKVTLTRGFWFSQTEVTQAAFRKIMGYDPSVFEGDDLPVESVTWNEADAYCSAIGGRLPTEWEWE